MLIVAEKYQTGFDEPLLHTMFVDKKLNDVKAVQTLSRLNRTCTGKNDTFILDFVNTADEIKEAFQPYYEGTVLDEETNPNTIYDLKYQLDEMRVYTTQEINGFADLYFSNTEADAARLSNYLRPAIDRFKMIDKIKQEEFKSGLSSFLRVYSFVTNVEKIFDKEAVKNGFDAQEIKFIEGLLFLSMIPLHVDNLQRQTVFYLKSLELLNDVIGNLKEERCGKKKNLEYV